MAVIKKPNYILDFSSESEVVVPDDSALDVSYFTITAHINWQATVDDIHSENSSFFGKMYNYLFGVTDDGGDMKLECGYMDEFNEQVGNVSNTILTPGESYYVAMINGEDELKFNINGKTDENTVSSKAAKSDSYDLSIGYVPDAIKDSYGHWIGYLDDVRLYDIGLTERQNKKLARAKYRQDVAPDHLVGHWKFNEGIGGTAKDLSGSGNDGSLYGPSWLKIGHGMFL